MTWQRTMQRFARWHIWLGWLVGFPILMWTATGLFMVARPIEEVRGDHLRAAHRAVDPAQVRFPATIGEPIHEARRIAQDAYAGEASLEAVRYLPPGEAPNEARSSAAVWQARFADGTHVYIDDATGEVLALRTGQWRLYDVMWGLHIMDLQTRDDTHHPILIGFAALATIGALLGCTLLFRRRKARVKG